MLLGWKRPPVVLRDGRQGCYPTRCLLGNGFLFVQKRGLLFAQQRGLLFALMSVHEREVLFAQISVRGPPHVPSFPKTTHREM